MCEGVPLTEDIVGEPEEKAGLAHRGVADEEQFEQVVVVLIHKKLI